MIACDVRPAFLSRSARLPFWECEIFPHFPSFPRCPSASVMYLPLPSTPVCRGAQRGAPIKVGDVEGVLAIPGASASDDGDEYYAENADYIFVDTDYLYILSSFQRLWKVCDVHVCVCARLRVRVCRRAMFGVVREGFVPLLFYFQAFRFPHTHSTQSFTLHPLPHPPFAGAAAWGGARGRG